MLITFRSKAAADVIMFGEVGLRMLSIMGKDGDDAQGILTVAQLPNAIQALQHAVNEDKAAQAALPALSEDEEEALRHQPAPISLTQRAVPLIELLSFAQRDAQPVLWQRT